MIRKRIVEIYCNKSGNEPYTIWINSLKDPKTKERIEQRISRIESGNFGDHCSVG